MRIVNFHKLLILSRIIIKNTYVSSPAVLKPNL